MNKSMDFLWLAARSSHPRMKILMHPLAFFMKVGEWDGVPNAARLAWPVAAQIPAQFLFFAKQFCVNRWNIRVGGPLRLYILKGFGEATYHSFALFNDAFAAAICPA